MDHQAIAQLLGNYGKFVGAFAVVTTLAFLALQIRQNTKAMRSQTYTSWATTTAIVHQMLMENAETVARVQDEGLSWDELDTKDRIVMRSLFVHLMNTFETSFLNHLDGTIDDLIFDAKHRNMVYTFSSVPLYLTLWNQRVATGGGPWDRRFANYVNEKVLKEVNRSLPSRI